MLCLLTVRRWRCESFDLFQRSLTFYVHPPFQTWDDLFPHPLFFLRDTWRIILFVWVVGENSNFSIKKLKCGSKLLMFLCSGDQNWSTHFCLHFYILDRWLIDLDSVIFYCRKTFRLHQFPPPQIYAWASTFTRGAKCKKASKHQCEIEIPRTWHNNNILCLMWKFDLYRLGPLEV